MTSQANVPSGAEHSVGWGSHLDLGCNLLPCDPGMRPLSCDISKLVSPFGRVETQPVQERWPITAEGRRADGRPVETASPFWGGGPLHCGGQPRASPDRPGQLPGQGDAPMYPRGSLLGCGDEVTSCPESSKPVAEGSVPGRGPLEARTEATWCH